MTPLAAAADAVDVADAAAAEAAVEADADAALAAMTTRSARRRRSASQSASPSPTPAQPPLLTAAPVISNTANKNSAAPQRAAIRIRAPTKRKSRPLSQIPH